WLALLKQSIGKKQASRDPYGHWWLEFDGESYGWWPKAGVGLFQTLTGVPGQLNGTDGGYAAGLATATRDSHHGDSADEEFHPNRRRGFFGGAKLKYGKDAG